jgi:hypothetical protein
METPYQVLGISPAATSTEVKAAWKKKIRSTHPDFGGDSKEFMKINQAYQEILHTPKITQTWTPKDYTKESDLKANGYANSKHKSNLKTYKSNFLQEVKSYYKVALYASLLILSKTPTPIVIDSLSLLLSMILPFTLVGILIRKKITTLNNIFPLSVKALYFAILSINPLAPNLSLINGFLALTISVLTYLTLITISKKITSK